MVPLSRSSLSLFLVSAHWRQLLSQFLLSALIVLPLGCQKGDTGPAGPPGQSGSSSVLVLEFFDTPAAPRADGISSASLKVRATTPQGNRLVGVSVDFALESGAGAVSPSTVVTNGLGEATTTFVSGSQPGFVVVTGSVDWHGDRIAAAESLYVDPLAVSLPLLAKPLGAAAAPHWSPDGNSIFVEDFLNRQLMVVPTSGGSSSYFGAYQGGISSPDGSDRLAAYTATADRALVLDTEGNILAGPMYPHPKSGYFFGSIISVGWVRGGDSLAVASNTNGLLAISDLGGTAGRAFELPVWVRDMSPAGSSVVIIQGIGEYDAGIYSLDLDSRSTTLLVRDTDFYSESGTKVLGISVDLPGNSVVYAGRTLQGGIYTMDHDLHLVPSAGGQDELMLASPYEELYPEWSPDGKKVAFCSNRGGTGFNIYVYSVPASLSKVVRSPGPSWGERSHALKNPVPLRTTRSERMRWPKFSD